MSDPVPASAGDPPAEVEEAQRQLSASRMHAEVRQIRAHADTEPTQAIVVGALH